MLGAISSLFQVFELCLYVFDPRKKKRPVSDLILAITIRDKKNQEKINWLDSFYFKVDGEHDIKSLPTPLIFTKELFLAVPKSEEKNVL